MLERGGGLRDEDESGVCVAREWKDLGDVGKGGEVAHVTGRRDNGG